MRILDRYILTTFLKNYLISFMVLIGLYVVLDMVINFDELVRIQPDPSATGLQSILSIVWDIGDFYFFQIFPIYALLSGIIAVVAAAFTLMRLSRFNELVAILAAGVPLLRVVMPIIIAGAVLSGLVIVDNELIIPHIIPQLQRDRKEAGRIINKTFPVWSMRDDDGRLLTAALFHSGPGNPSMDQLSVISTDEHFQPISLLTADQATWNPEARRWDLSPDATLTTGLLPNQQLHKDHSIRTYQSNITPVEITLYRSRDFVRLLSTNKINELLQQKQSYGLTDLLKVKHSRFTQPIMNIILLLLAIPTVLTREPGKLKSGAIKCVILTGLAMGTAFVAQQFTPPADSAWALQWPAILAWLPVFMFGPLSIYLLDRVKT
jgi:lipopolysaccharide export system permease protein